MIIEINYSTILPIYLDDQQKYQVFLTGQISPFRKKIERNPEEQRW